MTRAESSERRKAMAMRVNDGEHPGNVANAFGVCSDTVRAACEQHQVECCVRRRRQRTRILGVIARLLKPNTTVIAIARKYHVTRQRVYQIQDDAIAAGIPIKKRKVTP